MFVRALPAAIISLGLAFAGNAVAAGLSLGTNPALGSFGGPIGFQRFCKKHTEHCEDHPTTRPLGLNESLKKLLERVQKQVNHSILPQAEAEGEDLWRFGAAYGDCEDYALAKYQELLKRGLARGDMRFAVVLTETGDYHAVLTVETSEGSIVLDNRHERPLALDAAELQNYRWIAAQRLGQPTSWDLTPFGRRYAAGLEQSATAGK